MSEHRPSPIQLAAAAGYRPDMRKHRREMFERACEQGIAYINGDMYEWREGFGPDDVEWDKTTPHPDDYAHLHPIVAEAERMLCDAIYEVLCDAVLKHSRIGLTAGAVSTLLRIENRPRRAKAGGNDWSTGQYLNKLLIEGRVTCTNSIWSPVLPEGGAS